MLNVGLTGSIGCGKSTIAAMLRNKGAYVIDFDVLAHQVEEPGQPVWKAIVDFFGREVLNSDQTINRASLGAVVFADPDKLQMLNNIVHPAVIELWRCRLAGIEGKEPGAIVISDVPLLIEAGIKSLFDLIIVVHISPEEQLNRVVARDCCSMAEAKRRLSSQMPIDEKIKYADIVFDNQGSLAATKTKMDNIWRELTAREKKKRLIQEEMKR